MHFEVVEHNVNVSHGRIEFPVQNLQQHEEVDLAFAVSGAVIHLASPCVEGGKQMECSFTLIFALHTGRPPWLRGQRLGLAGAWLQVGLFVHAEYSLMPRQGTAVQIAQVPNRVCKGSVTGGFGRQPQMMTQGLSRWCSSRRRTLWAEMLATAPSA